MNAYETRDAAALQRLNDHYHRTFTFDDLWAEIWRRNYAFRQRSSRVPKNYLPLDEAQIIIAQDAGFSSWAALLKAVATGAPPTEPYDVDPGKKQIGPRRRLTDDEWDGIIAEIRERGITSLAANGLMTDAVLARIAECGQIASLIGSCTSLLVPSYCSGRWLIAHSERLKPFIARCSRP